MIRALLTDPLSHVLAAIYAGRKAVLLLRELVVLRNEWLRRER